MSKADQVLNYIKTQLEQAFPAGTVKQGWPASYVRDVTAWPLVTIAPAISNATHNGPSFTDAINWHIQLVYAAQDAEQTVTDLMAGLLTVRQALVAQRKTDRFQNWQGLISGPPTESREARYIDPEPGQPYAGLSFVLATTITQTLE